jgi:endonuclease/exonuclease/phosphatase family metal-dependent hydrolase
MGWLSLALGLSGIRLFGFFTGPLLPNSEIHRVVGEPARYEGGLSIEDRIDASHLNVVTWNIERGTAYASILRALRELNADIVLLQEVDRDCRRTGYRDVARDLSDALRMNWVAAGEFQEIGEARGRRAAITGQAILSRFPIEDATTLGFKAQDRLRWLLNPAQPRRGGRIALKARTAGITIYNAHIESGDNRNLQRKQIAEIVADDALRGVGGPVVIGGDFNSGPLRHASTFASLHAAEFADALGDAADRGPTSTGARDPIDWIFVKNLTPARGRVLSLVGVSDHFPVAATVASRRAWTLRR